MSDGPLGPTITAKFPDLAGKVAIVTGGGRGIGIGIAEFLGNQGMKLLLTGRTEPAGLATTAKLVASGADARWITADVSTADGAQHAFDETISAFGRIDLLVNNAANVRLRKIMEIDEAFIHDSLLANVQMSVRLSLLTAHWMVQAGVTGSIVHISSVGGLRGHRENMLYDASKGAIDAMTRSMAVDLAPHGIRVNAVAPGATRRPDSPNKRDKSWQEKEPLIPLNRRGTGVEVGAAIAFLASDAGAYITGQILYVDGGMTAQLSPPGIWI